MKIPEKYLCRRPRYNPNGKYWWAKVASHVGWSELKNNVWFEGEGDSISTELKTETKKED